MKGLMVLLLVTVIECNAMSKHELEEFSNFLRRASTLDQNLKDGFHAFDEDEEASDHAWEESGKFEGDLILNERQRRVIVEDVAEGLSRNGLKDSTKRWPDNEVIYYIQREHFSSDQVQAIKDGIDDLGRASCIKFRPYKKGDRDAVVIQGSRRGCFSQVGYQGGYQVLNLSARHPVGRGCFRHGTVVHEMLHTLGFYHMQSSPDRDDYIDVKWENIVEPAKHNFRKYNLFSVSDFGVGYDYDSVLHYSRRAFSSNGKPTLVPKQDGARIGQRVGLSDKDTQKLNKMYCDADSNNFEQADDAEPKVILKKKSKNLPFQGHGIGYHQGKTVVIKLPAAGTYNLADSPSHSAFDYFSKAPQAVSPTLVQGSGIGKEVAYRPSIANDLKEYNNDALHKEIKRKPNYEFQFKTSPKNDTVLVNSVKNATDDDVSTEKQKDSRSDKNVNNNKSKEDSSANSDYDVKEAFDRLEKLIKSRVYPSNFESHNPKIYYSKYYNPDKKIEKESNAEKIDKLFTRRPNFLKDKHNGEFDVETITPGYKLPKYYADEYHGEVDASYGTSYPFKKLLEKEKKLSEKYSIPSELRKYNQFNDKQKSDSPNVPLNEPWYKVDQLKPSLQYSTGYAKTSSPAARQNYKEKGNYDKHQNPLVDFGYYTDPKSLEYLAKKQDYSSLYKPTDVNREEDTTKPYTLFGKPVPINEPWFKTNTVGAPLSQNEFDKSNKSLADSNKDSQLFNKDSKEVDKPVIEDSEDQSGSQESVDSSSRSAENSHDSDGDKLGNFVKAKVERYDYSKESAENDHHIPTTVKPAVYDITEYSDEHEDEGKPASEDQTDNTNSSAGSDESSSTDADMDARLRGILNSYKKYDDYDISSPYTGHEKSSQESEDTH